MCKVGYILSKSKVECLKNKDELDNCLIKMTLENGDETCQLCDINYNLNGTTKKCD